MDWEYRMLTFDASGSSQDIGIEVSGSPHRGSGEGWEFVGAFPLRISTSSDNVVRLGVVYRRGCPA